MNLYVLDKKFETVAVIDMYTSIIWTNRYYSYGDFELYLPVNGNTINTLKKDYYLVREGQEDNAMIIDKIKITTDEEEGNFLTITGKCLKSILYRRIVWNQTNLNNTLESCMKQLLNENIICAEDPKRNIEKLEIKAMIRTNVEIEAQYCGENLGEVISTLCEQNGLGWDIKLDLDKKKFNFILYSGINRSCQQNKNLWIVFSDKYDNLLKTEYTYSKENYKNVALVAGEGEGIERRCFEVGKAEGMERFETFVDAGDISSNSEQISEEGYNAQLKQKGEEYLAENKESETFEGEVIDCQFSLGKDYFLGDIVEIENEYGMQAVSRITEVIESIDESGVYTIPTFSAWEGCCVEETENKEIITFTPQKPSKPEPEEPTYIEMTFTGKEFNQAVKSVFYGYNPGITAAYTDQYAKVKSITLTDIPPTNKDCVRELRDNVINDDYVLVVYTSEENREDVKIYTNADTIILPQDCSYMFYRLRYINNLDLSRFDTSYVTNMSYMFAYCGYYNSMKEAIVDLGEKFDTSNVVDMTNMFNAFMNNWYKTLGSDSKFDESVEGELDLGEKFDTSNVEGMSYMFNGCAIKTFLLGEKFVIKDETDIDRILGGYNNYTALPLRTTTTIYAPKTTIDKISNIKLYDIIQVYGCMFIEIN